MIYRIIDTLEGDTDKYKYTLDEVKEFFKPSEGDCQMDKELLPAWEKITDMLTLGQYLAMLGQKRYEVKGEAE